MTETGTTLMVDDNPMDVELTLAACQGPQLTNRIHLTGSGPAVLD